MREINAAWAVLGDVRTKERYDLELALARAQASRSQRSTGAAGASLRPPTPLLVPDRSRGEGDDAEYGVWSLAFRYLPWMALLVVLGGIFIVTAFAGVKDPASAPRRGTPGNPIVAAVLEIGNCVRFPSAIELDLVDCTEPNRTKAKLCPL